MATTNTVTAPIVMTEVQSTILRNFIDQVTAYKYGNPDKVLKGLQLGYDSETNQYSIALDVQPAPKE